DNRGIISVLASDQNDVGAGFTNYGLASVDIAAPGVSTLSTVPTTSCTLCDPSGYKLLSGTSMATPHVSGVLAAMFHKNPALTANQARDVVLDPASYDALSDTRASTTSTGGRLNFAKSIANRSEEHTSELQSRFDLVCRLPASPAPFPYTTLFRSIGNFNGDAARLRSAGRHVPQESGADRQPGTGRRAGPGQLRRTERYSGKHYLDRRPPQFREIHCEQIGRAHV